MIKQAYPKWFNDWWKTLLDLSKKGAMRSLGSKHEAYKEARKLKVTEQDLPYLTKQYIIQRDAKIQARLNGAWQEDFPDICRWLKHRRFENEPTTHQRPSDPVRTGRKDQCLS